MKKIPSLFQRDFTLPNNPIVNKLNPECEWVTKNEGVAYRKLDGTAAMIKDGILYKRYDCKNGKTPPENFIPCQDPDPVTGHWPGWIAVDDKPEDRWFREGVNSETYGNGIFELIGPSINKNPEAQFKHVLCKHNSQDLILDPPTDFDLLKEWFKGKDMEGIVWHHPDGRMCKIKKRDFGLKRGE